MIRCNFFIDDINDCQDFDFIFFLCLVVVLVWILGVNIRFYFIVLDYIQSLLCISNVN